MAVFRLLVRRYPDALPAGEIASALQFKASTTSVYLSALMDCGLITQNREGTSLRYGLDLDGAQAVVTDLFVDCCKGRPDLCPPVPEPLKQRRICNVLFICTGNSARSLMAEAILRHEAASRFTAYSAGLQPKPEPAHLALETLRSAGIDTKALQTKSISTFKTSDTSEMDFVFTVCDQAANEDCPTWSGQAIATHWGLPNPAHATGGETESRLAFQRTFQTLKARITAFAALPLQTLAPAALQAQLDRIGQLKD
jgi:protein-tyrosine-phosphatase